MKSEHRHELQQNELRKLTRKVQPWFEQHGMQAVVGLAAGLVIAFGAAYWFNSQSTTGSDGWTKLPGAQTTEEFASVAEKYSDSLPGLWARLRAAELNLESGILDEFKDRELALIDLKRAKEDFEKVLAAKIELPDPLKERAQLGLARALEATCDGDTAPVVEAYQRLLRQFPETVFKNHVEQRIKDLQTPGAREFYAWFHAQKPKPPDFKKPLDGAKSSTAPFDPFNMPPSAAPAKSPGESTPADAP